MADLKPIGKNPFYFIYNISINFLQFIHKFCNSNVFCVKNEKFSFNKKKKRSTSKKIQKKFAQNRFFSFMT